MQQYPKGNVPNMALTSRRQGPTMGQTMGHIQQHLSMSNQSHPNHFVNSAAAGVQQRNNQRNVGMNMPGPIQRPSQQLPNQTAAAQVNFSSMQQHHPQQAQQHHQQQAPVNVPVEFKKSQRQKMLDDTKKYFQQQEQKKTVTPSNPIVKKEQMDDKQVSSNPSTDENVSKKIVPPPPSTKGSANGNEPNRSMKHGDAKKKRDPSSVPATNSQQPQHGRRNVTSKV